MVDKQTVDINVSAFRQFQSDIQSVIFKMESFEDQLIYVCDAPDDAIHKMYEAVTILDATIENLTYVDEYQEELDNESL